MGFKVDNTVSAGGDVNRIQKAGPLEGVRVLEFGSLLAGPSCARLLADFGAEVIKVEAPDGGDPMRTWGPVRQDGQGLVWPFHSRNKKSITLDLHGEVGQQLALRLAAVSDVVIENFRPGTMEKWNLGYENLRKVNQRVIMVRVSGYGQTGPYRNRAGFGAAAGAMGGLRFLTGYPDRPPVRAGLSIEDSVAGLQAAVGALIALYSRDANAQMGQVVDVAITEAVLALTEGTVTEYDVTGVVRQREGTTLTGVAPSNIYQTSDGGWVVIAANADNPFKRLFDAIGRLDIANDSELKSHEARWRARDTLDVIISEWTALHTSDEVIRELDAAGVPCAPIYTAADIVDDPHFKSRDMIVRVDDQNLGSIAMQGVVPKLQGTPGSIKWSGPSLGQHNEEIYLSVLQLPVAEFDEYRRLGVI